MNCSQWLLDIVAIAFLAVMMQTAATVADARLEAVACTAAQTRNRDAQLEDHGCVNTAEGDGAAAANGAASALLAQMSLRNAGDRSNPVVLEAEEVAAIASQNTSTITEEQEQPPASQVPDTLMNERPAAESPQETQTATPASEAVEFAIPPQPPLGPAVVGLPMDSIQPPNASDASSDGTALAAIDGTAPTQPPLNDTQTPSVAEALAASIPTANNVSSITPIYGSSNSTGSATAAAVAVAAVADDAVAASEPPVNATQPFDTRDTTDSSVAATVFAVGSDGSSEADVATTDNASDADATLQPTAEASDASDVIDASASYTDLDTGSRAGNPANTVAEVASDAAAVSESPLAAGSDGRNEADAATIDNASDAGVAALQPAAEASDTSAIDDASGAGATLPPTAESSNTRNVSEWSQLANTAKEADVTADVKDTASMNGTAATTDAETSISTDSFSLAATRLTNLIQSIARSEAATTSLLSMMPQWLRPSLEMLHEVALQPPPEATQNPDVVVDEEPPREQFGQFKWNCIMTVLPLQAIVTLIAFFYWVHNTGVSPEADGVANPSDFDHWRTGICCNECSQDCAVRFFVAFCVPSVRWADTLRRLGLTGFWFAFACFMICRLVSSIVGVPEFLITIVCTGMRQEMRHTYGFQNKGGCTWLFDCLLIMFCFPCAVVQEAEQADAAFRVGLPVAVRPIWKKLPYPADESACCLWHEQCGSAPKSGSSANSYGTAESTKGDTAA